MVELPAVASIHVEAYDSGHLSVVVQRWDGSPVQLSILHPKDIPRFMADYIPTLISARALWHRQRKEAQAVQDSDAATHATANATPPKRAGATTRPPVAPPAEEELPPSFENIQL